MKRKRRERESGRKRKKQNQKQKQKERERDEEEVVVTRERVFAFHSFTSECFLFFLLQGLAAVQLGQVLGAKVVAAASTEAKLREIGRITGLPPKQLVNSSDLKKFKVMERKACCFFEDKKRRENIKEKGRKEKGEEYL